MKHDSPLPWADHLTVRTRAIARSHIAVPWAALGAVLSAVLGAALGIAWGLPDAQAADAVCRKGQRTAFIRVVFEHPGLELPCAVLLQSSLAPPRRIWHARHTAGFCEVRAAEKRNRLIAEGWRCDRLEALEAERQARAYDRGEEAAAADLKQVAKGQGAARSPASLLRQAKRKAYQKARLPLGDVVHKDARRIAAWLQEKPWVRIGGRGDLDGDGADDAVALLAYRSDQNVRRQILMAYVARGDTYRLGALKLLPGAGATVRAVDHGVIWISQFQAGFGMQESGYVLKQKQLVELTKDAVARR